MVVRRYDNSWIENHRRGKRNCKPASSHMEMADDLLRLLGKSMFESRRVCREQRGSAKSR